MKRFKTVFIIVIFSLCATELNAQNNRKQFSIMLSPYLIADVGRSYNATLNYCMSEKIKIYAGVKYHQNILTDAKLNSEVLHHRFYANSTIQKIGANVGMQYYINWPYDFIQPFLYYDVTLFNMDTRAFVLTDIDTTGNVSRRKELKPVNYKNLLSVENNLGLGIRGKVIESLYLNVRGGVGANFIFNLPVSEYSNAMHINPSFQYSIGIEYVFK